MPSPESGPGGSQGKPLREQERRRNPLDVDINKMLNQQPKKGGELVPVDKSKASSAPDTIHPHYNGHHGNVQESLNPSQADLAPATAPARRGHRRQNSGNSGGGVATLERSEVQPHVQAQTQTSDVVPAPPPEVGIEAPKPESADPLRIVLTSLDQNVDAFAREAAHEKMSKKHEGPFWKRIAKSAWDNMSREYQLVKATKEARQEIRENDNLLHHQGTSDEKWREATINRYGSEYGEHLIHEGETFHRLNEQQPDPERQQKAERIKDDSFDLLRSYARGDVSDDASFDMMVGRVTDKWREDGVSQDYIGEGEFLAHNLGDKARELKAMLDSAEGLNAVDREAKMEEILANAELVAGEARVGSRTEIDSTLSERVAEKLRNVPFLNEGRIAKITAALSNETVIAAMISGGVYAAKRGASIAGKIVAPGIGAGVVAAIRERNALMDERALEARRDDSGMEAPETPDAARGSALRRGLRKVGIGRSTEEYRAEVKATQYESRPAGELLGELGGLYNESGELNVMDRDSMDRAMSLMGQIRARIQIGDRTGARLINYADISPEEMEGRRFDLDLAMAKLETDMGKMFKNPVAQAMLDIKPEENFEDLASQQREVANGMLMGEMKDKDRLFNKLIAKRALKRALAATFMGAAIGSAVRYGAEGVREAINSAREMFSNLFEPSSTGAPAVALADFEVNGSGGVDHVGSDGSGTPDHVGTAAPTTPDHVGTSAPDHGGQAAPDHVGTDTQTPDHVGSDATTPDHVGSAGTPDHLGSGEGANAGESTQISDTSKLNLPEGYKAEVGSNDTVTLTGPDGKEYSGLGLNSDGSLSNTAIETLKSYGFSVNDHQEIIQGKPEISHSEVSATQFVENHRSDMKTIHHTKWFDNNTSKFDLNELGLQNQMDSNGNLIVNIKSMTAGGSFHGASGVDWHEAAKDGHLKVYLSASQGTQSQAFEIDVRPDGTAVIDKDNPAMALFDDRGKFIGGFQEIALNGGQASDGGENIATLATVVGNHANTLNDTIQTPTLQTAHSYIITPPVQPTAYVAPPPNNIFPFVPVTGRRRIGDERRQPESAPPAGPDVVAPVIPIRGGSEAPALPPAPSAPPLRNEAAERLAEERGLPAAPQPALESSANAAAGANEANRSEQPPSSEGFTPDEARLVSQIDSETREFPPQFDQAALTGLSGRERRLVTRLAYDAMMANPRGSGENPLGYTRRILRVLHDGAQRGRAERLPLMSPRMRAVATKAFQALSSAKVSSGNNNGDQQAA